MPGNHLIENRVTDTEDVDYHRVLQQWQQVVGHSLPEMEQKILDLKQNIWLSVWVEGKLFAASFPLHWFHNNKMISCNRNDHLLKVDINGIVQNALAVSFIHHDQSVHLQRQWWRRNYNGVMGRNSDTENIYIYGSVYIWNLITNLFSGDVSLQQKMLSVGEVWQQCSSFRTQRVFPGETSLKNIQTS